MEHQRTPFLKHTERPATQNETSLASGRPMNKTEVHRHNHYLLCALHKKEEGKRLLPARASIGISLPHGHNRRQRPSIPHGLFLTHVEHQFVARAHVLKFDVGQSVGLSVERHILNILVLIAPSFCPDRKFTARHTERSLV